MFFVTLTYLRILIGCVPGKKDNIEEEKLKKETLTLGIVSFSPFSEHSSESEQV